MRESLRGLATRSALASRKSTFRSGTGVERPGYDFSRTGRTDVGRERPTASLWSAFFGRSWGRGRLSKATTTPFYLERARSYGSGIFVLLFSLAASGCGTNDSRDMDQQGFFPDGVPVRVGSVELRVGDDTGLLLNTPTGMLLGRGGQLFIVDGGERQVYVLDGTTGEPVAQFGHGGEGPGALVSPNTIGEDAQGRLWVNGWRWTSVFGPEDQGFGPVGRVDRVERLPPLDILSIPVPHGEGMRIAGVQMQLENDLSEIPRSTLSMVDVSMAEDGIDSEASVAWALDPVSDSIVEAIEIVHADDQRRRFARAPVFGATVVLRAHAPDGRVAQAGGGLYRIRIVSPDGLPAGEVEGPELPAVPLSPVEEERHVEQFAAFDGPESRLRAIDIYTPSHKQPIRNIAFDGANRLWVLLSVPDDSPFDVAHVFSPDGQMSEVVVWPQGISLLGTNRRPYRAIGDDFAWGIERDDLDVSSVVRLGFRTLSGEELAEMTSMLGMP